MDSRSGRRLGPEPPRRASGRLGAQPPRGARRRPQHRRRFSAGDGDGVDRISALPDDLLREVLARLRCARSAATTSVLSRRWRGLWRHLPALSFRNVSPGALSAALAQVDRPELSLLHIRVHEDHCLSAAGAALLLFTVAGLAPAELVFRVGKCVGEGIAVKMPTFHRAKSISINLALYPWSKPQLVSGGDFPLLERLSVARCHLSTDDMIMRCPRLRVLEVRRCSVENDIVKVHSTTMEELIVDNVSGVDINAPVLKRLSVTDSQRSITAMISHCPCLRVLELRCHRQHDVFRVHSLTIEELVVDIHVDGSLLGVDIVAPALKKFTLSGPMRKEFIMSFSAPVVENLSWNCWFNYPNQDLVVIDGIWCLSRMKLRMEKSIYALNLNIYTKHPSSVPYERKLQEIVQLPPNSVLELHLDTKRHVYGAMMVNVLGIFTAIQRLKLVIYRESSAKACPSNCPCDQLQDWRSQSISMTALKVVEIENFQGSGHEVGFLKILFRCATLMKRVTVNLSPLTIHRGCKNMYNIFKANRSVKCSVYDSCDA